MLEVSTIYQYHIQVNKKHRRTLDAIHARPTQANIKWSDIEALFRACGAEVREGRGSRVRVIFPDRRGIFHRPHPGKEANKSTVEDIRDLLTSIGVAP